jgi:hypothetical protein
MNRAGSAAGLTFLAEPFAFLNIFFKLARAFGLLAFALFQAPLRLGLQAGVAFRARFIGRRGFCARFVSPRRTLNASSCTWPACWAISGVKINAPTKLT